MDPFDLNYFNPRHRRLFSFNQNLTFQNLKLHHQELLAWTIHHKFKAILIYMSFYTLAVTASVPGAVFLTVVGGFLFGTKLGLFCVVISATLGATFLYIQDIFQSLGVKAVSILFILDTVMIVIFQAPLVNSLRNNNPLSNIGLSLILMAMSMVILSVCGSFSLAILSCILWSMGEMLFIAMTQLICYEKGAHKKKGQRLGLLQSTLATSRVFGPTVGSFVYQFFSGKILWEMSAVICLLCLFLVLDN